MIAAHTAAPVGFPRPRALPVNLLTLTARELRDALRSRWFLLYTLAFVVLGAGVSYISAASVGGSGMSGFGRTSAGLVNLVLLVVPLMSLTAGAGAIAAERERGMLAYLLAQPVSRVEVLLGKFVGLSLTLLTSICLGFGGVAALLAANGSGANPAGIVQLAAFAFILALAMLSVGLLLSALARRTNVAIGSAVFVWLTFALVSDLGLMAGTLAFKISIEHLFALAMINPLQVLKMWSLRSIDASLDVLGPAGLYAQDTFGAALPWMFAGALAAWIVLPLLAAAIMFNKRTPV